MTARANLYIDQGTDFSVDLDVFDDSGNIVSLSGYDFAGDAKKVYSSSKEFSFNIEHVANTVNKLEVSLSSNNSLEVVPGKYQYDIVMTSPTNIKTKILEGLVFIVPTVTG
jgi:hypothetical protein